MTLYELVPAALRPKLEAWIIRRFGPLGANLHLVNDYDTSGIAELLALAGEPRFVAEARDMRQSPFGRRAELGTRIVAEHDP
ncbi:MAG TPA: hypothetical protein VGO00_15510, partial [Kofleriaceae bacterium]|nr:hypothetical protein [Kofleriaceae bacterium]